MAVVLAVAGIKSNQVKASYSVGRAALDALCPGPTDDEEVWVVGRIRPSLDMVSYWALSTLVFRAALPTYRTLMEFAAPTRGAHARGSPAGGANAYSLTD